jgi:chromatin segregation and condensation protein Rec8/ScpA/Scc1 (kleisin family)
VLRACHSRLAVVVTFLAVLELWHQARIIVQQADLFGPIELLPAPSPPVAAPADPAE